MEEIIPGSIIVTGASGSMGKAAVEALARKGRSVTMACRNLEKGERVRASILREVPSASLVLARVDLGSFSSIRAFVICISEIPENHRQCIFQFWYRFAYVKFSNTTRNISVSSR